MENMGTALRLGYLVAGCAGISNFPAGNKVGNLSGQRDLTFKWFPTSRRLP